jgi:tetratricopeptide (TPR) repeat protein
MTNPTVSERFLPALVLVLCCLSTCPALLFGQSNELTLKTNAASHRTATGLTIEKLIDLGRLPEAREKLREQFAKEGERPRLLLFEAMILYREKQYIESVRKLERVLSLHDSDPDVYKLIGLNLVSVGKADLAERYFEKAVALAPRDFMARYYLGLHQLTSKQYAQAEAGLRETIKLNPNYVDAWLLLGVAREQLGDEADALQTYRQAVTLAEQQTTKTETPYLYLARLLIARQEFAQSLPSLRRAVAINPQSAEALTLLGRVLSRLEQREEALRVLQEATRLAPQDKTPHYLLMSLYQKLGKGEEAQREEQLFRALEEKENQQ